jgi:hypothetical protein
VNRLPKGEWQLAPGLIAGLLDSFTGLHSLEPAAGMDIARIKKNTGPPFASGANLTWISWSEAPNIIS